jgi:sec-independent protein translocase protein TatA
LWSISSNTMCTPPLFLLLGAIGPWQIVLIVVVLLLLFGGKKIPELMRGLGQGMKEFKDATKADDKAGEERK